MMILEDPVDFFGRIIRVGAMAVVFAILYNMLKQLPWNEWFMKLMLRINRRKYERLLADQLCRNLVCVYDTIFRGRELNQVSDQNLQKAFSQAWYALYKFRVGMEILLNTLYYEYDIERCIEYFYWMELEHRIWFDINIAYLENDLGFEARQLLQILQLIPNERLRNTAPMVNN